MPSQITGVSGYIGLKALILALEAGFQVRAVIRKAEQATKLQSHARVAPHINSLQWVNIPDLSETHSFDPYLDGVTGILHIASSLANEVIIPSHYSRQKTKPAQTEVAAPCGIVFHWNGALPSAASCRFI